MAHLSWKIDFRQKRFMKITFSKIFQMQKKIFRVVLFFETFNDYFLKYFHPLNSMHKVKHEQKIFILLIQGLLSPYVSWRNLTFWLLCSWKYMKTPVTTTTTTNTHPKIKLSVSNSCVVSFLIEKAAKQRNAPIHSSRENPGIKIINSDTR